ncbi:MAG: phosphate/phosphite/phosphonate ABC transporter substrate-binding protein [Desulfuromonadaceae bacterium]
MKLTINLRYLVLILGCLLAVVACNRTEPPQISLKTTETAKEPASVPKVQPLRIGMGAMITPREGYIYYQRLQSYIEKRLGRPVQLVDRENYDEMNGLLESGGVDAAFVCAGPYVEGKAKFNLQLLAMPLVQGKPIYHSYILVHKDSAITSFKDLRGKVFAFTDPKSNSGKMVPTYMLAKMKETPESYFSRVEYTYGHDKSIRAVAEKLVDGAAVDSLIWEYTALKKPELTGQTRIIVKSEPYGIPPVVVRAGLDPEIKKRLKEILLAASHDPEGQDILKGMMIDGFIAGDDKNYDSIRAINVWITGRRKPVK